VVDKSIIGNGAFSVTFNAVEPVKNTSNWDRVVCYEHFHSQPGQELVLSSKTSKLSFGPGNGVRVKLTTHLLLLLRLGMHEAVLPLHHIPSWHVQGHLYLSLYLRVLIMWNKLRVIVPFLMQWNLPVTELQGTVILFRCKKVPFNTSSVSMDHWDTRSSGL
jgi:hypothetical protein